MRRHLRRLGIGAVVVGFGALVLGGPSLPVAPDTQYVLAVVVALLALLVAAWWGLDGWEVARERWTPADPEPGTRVPVPGDALADLDDATLRDRIRTLAIDALVTEAECTRETAAEYVDRGTWPDDRLGALYLRREIGEAPLFSQIRASLDGESIEERGRRRAIRAIHALREGEDA